MNAKQFSNAVVKPDAEFDFTEDELLYREFEIPEIKIYRLKPNDDNIYVTVVTSGQYIGVFHMRSGKGNPKDNTKIFQINSKYSPLMVVVGSYVGDADKCYDLLMENVVNVLATDELEPPTPRDKDGFIMLVATTTNRLLDFAIKKKHKINEVNDRGRHKYYDYNTADTRIYAYDIDKDDEEALSIINQIQVYCKRVEIGYRKGYPDSYSYNSTKIGSAFNLLTAINNINNDDGLMNTVMNTVMHSFNARYKARYEEEGEEKPHAFIHPYGPPYDARKFYFGNTKDDYDPFF